MLGSGTAGLVEVIRIPDEVKPIVKPGYGLMTFATPNLEEWLDQCRARGHRLSNLHKFQPSSTTSVSTAVTWVGGIPFELVRYEDPSS
jgi:hypothetical protein